MTAQEAAALGYEVVRASDYEVGLLKNGQGIRTWFCQDFDRKLPPLDHPLIQECIARVERTSYAPLSPLSRFWCKTHNRRATHLLFRSGMVPAPHCDPKLGGIMLPCECVPWIDTGEPVCDYQI